MAVDGYSYIPVSLSSCGAPTLLHSSERPALVAHVHPLLVWSAWVRHGGAAEPAAELARAARPGCNAAD
ncbi:hypothetical protein HaLaN_02161, partial [Haematococcus lacustris]